MIEPLTHTALDGTAHGFFTRQGGVSTGLYESLNTGLGSEDARTRVLENRDRVRQYLGATALATAYQTHSTVTAFIDAPQEAIKADALVTKTSGLAIGALAADCAPVLLSDTQNGIIGAAHSGWRGAFDGILASVAATMRENGGKHIAAVIGPCISKKAYEV
ncbi:MAG: polyphenol oxidase family protein, partial [Parvibaculales bacterium]